jgi:hypothetical protein
LHLISTVCSLATEDFPEPTLEYSLAFFAISNNVVILALRGMIAEFLFFVMIAAICFSGLLFTLWDLG